MKSTLLIAACFALPLALALEAQNPPVQTPKKTPILRPMPKRPASFDLDFRGGTVGNLVDQVKVLFQRAPNILVTPAAAKLPVPAIKLSSVDLQGLMNALPNFLGGQESKTTRKLRVQTTHSRTGKTIYTLHVYDYRSPRSYRPRTMTQVFNIANLIDSGRFKVEDLVTAIETGWKMDGEKEKPDLQYHVQTRLLLIKGSNSAINLASNVLRQLQTANRTRTEIAKLKNENLKLQLRIAQLEKELTVLRKSTGRNPVKAR